MSQHDFNIANQGFPAFRSDLNNALAALASNSAGTSEPSSTYAYQFWYDSTANLLKMRNAADDAWITLAFFDQANDEWEVRSAVIQAVDSAGVVIKTDDGNTRLTIADDGTVTVDGTLDVDTIAEKTSGSGVTIDGVLLKDNKIAKAGLPAGSVLQVVNASTSTDVTASTTTYVDTGLTASITPTSATSKIIVLINQNGCRKSSGDSTTSMDIKLFRGATDLGTFAGALAQTNSAIDNIVSTSLSYSDSPNTTSSVTYKTQIRSRNNTASVSVQFANASLSTITLMEIAG